MLALAPAKTNAVNIKNMINRLTGYIETVSNWHIESISLPSLKTVIDRIGPDYIVNDFDVSRDGKERVVTVTGVGKLAKLVTYSHNKEIKLILEKRSLRAPSLSPDGKNILYLMMEEEDHPVELHNIVNDWYLYLSNINGSSDKQILKMPVAHFKPSWFPDGKRIAISTKDLRTYIIDTTTHTEKKIVDFGYAPVVSHDGKKIAYLSHDVSNDVKKKIIDYTKWVFRV